MTFIRCPSIREEKNERSERARPESLALYHQHTFSKNLPVSKTSRSHPRAIFKTKHTVAAKTAHEVSNMNVPARPPPARTSMVPLLQRPRNEPAVGVGPDRPETVRRGRGAGVGVVGGVR